MEEASARTIILSEAKDDRMEAGIDTMEAKDGTTYCKNAAILIHYYAKSAHITRLMDFDNRNEKSSGIL